LYFKGKAKMNPLAKIKSIFAPKKKKKGKSKSAHYPSYRSSKKASDSGWRAWLKRFFIKSAIYGSLAGGIVVGILWLTLPDISELNKVSKIQSILIKSEDGQIIGSFGDVYGDYLRFNEFPSSLVDAVIATEDRNFYHHFGVDPIGVLRATFANIRAGHVVQGASTVTQQVAKNVFLTPERSYIRKAKEILLAFKLEHKFSKEAIMSIYLNRVYLGAGSYGVDAASKRYFGKSARDMNLAESAIMAGLLKAPSRYAPSSNPARSLKRADQVLVNMEDAGFLTQKQSDRARAQLADSMKNKKPNSQSTFYFADYIADQLPEYVGNVDEDLVVTTTLRPEWQTMGEKSMTEIMDKNAEKMKVSQAALLAMSPDGAIRVMIGGRSYAENQYNRVSQSQRQPGSAFKMFVYLAGLEGGLTPDTMMEDAPLTIPISGGNWRPQNYTHKYEGQMTLKQALAESINTVAVQVSEAVGRGNVINMAQRLGITADMQPVPSIALGATEVSLLELTNAYAHLASNGAIVYPYGILEIKTAKGKKLYHREETTHGKVLDSGVVGMMNEMLASVVTSGTGRGAQIGRSVAGKTGTTSDYKDAWFIGYTPDLVAGVWVGNDDNVPMKKVTGGTLPASIFRGFMGAALAGTPAHSLPTGGGFFNALPWNTTAPEVSQRPAEEIPEAEQEIPTENPAPPAPKPDPQKHDVQLGDSFWKKLKE
jgi:penicillin-binding protein 1A